MATRVIVTSQPDVACDVCSRRLLRGEQPDVFLAAGRRLTVCELCAPRAVQEGWMRESEHSDLALAPARPRRGRTLIDRLRGGARQAPAGPERAAEGPPVAAEGHYDLFDADSEPAAAPAAPQAPAAAEAPVAANARRRGTSSVLQDALDVFNASEFPRRVSGVSRSLGAPVVSARAAEHHPAIVRVVVAWELCWYRYEIDLSEPTATIQVLAQGTELSELEREDRVGNAHATDGGGLELAP